MLVMMDKARMNGHTLCVSMHFLVTGPFTRLISIAKAISRAITYSRGGRASQREYSMGMSQQSGGEVAVLPFASGNGKRIDNQRALFSARIDVVFKFKLIEAA